MNQYFTYLIIAALTIASPGPGVVLSISNSLKYGLRGAIPGIIGVAGGMFIVSLISATSIGVFLKSSQLAFSIAKAIGAGYLVYLGIKLLRSSSVKINNSENNFSNTPSIKSRFKEGIILTLSNPKPILFFVALFPQFINAESSYTSQFMTLSFSFCALVLIIHLIYGLFAHSIKNKIMSAGGFTIINKIAGTCFLFFAGIIFYTIKL